MIVSASLAWLVIYCAAVVMVPARSLYRGKILTMPIRRRTRLFSPTVDGIFDIRGANLRLIQLVTVGWGIGWFIPYAFCWLLMILLYLDDRFTGDDDRWKKFKESVRNRVKWKMKLPQPVTVR